MSWDFAAQVLITIWALYCYWYGSRKARLAAGALFLLSGIDGLIDAPKFLAAGDVAATVAEVGWILWASWVTVTLWNERSKYLRYNSTHV